jgi:O-antigen/teichoic acid export membrane protein
VTFFSNRRVGREDDPRDLELPRAAVVLIVGGAGLSTLMSLALYLFPDRMIQVWPWPLTELTARMLGAICALGIVGYGVWYEPRWSSARILVQVAMIMLLLILLGGVRARAEFDPSKALTWVFAAGFVVTLCGAAGLYMRMERVRSGRHPAASDRGSDEPTPRPRAS